MKNKKGFTLPELLAVVVILALIALIAVPIFSKIVNQNRTKSYEASAHEYVKAIETKLESIELKEVVDFTSCTSVKDEAKLLCGGKTIELNYNGKSPISGTIELNGISVASANIKFIENETILYDGKTFTTTENEADVYTITFDPMGGTVSQPTKQISKGSTYGTLPIPTKSGYVFKGWYMNLVKTIKFSSYEIQSGSGIPYSTTSSNYICTLDLIPVKGGTKFYSNKSICGFYTFNGNQKFIKRENNYTTSATMSSNAEYMRIEVATKDLSEFESTAIITDNVDNLTYENVKNKITSNMKIANNNHTLYAAWEAK